MLTTILVCVIIVIFALFMREHYVVGLDEIKRGSPDLIGWNMGTIFRENPIIIDDLEMHKLLLKPRVQNKK